MAKDMVGNRFPTEQQQNVELDKKAYGKRASALNARPATEAGSPENEGEFRAGGYMFRHTPYQFSENTRKETKKTSRKKSK